MAKKKNNRYLLYGGILVVAVAAYMMTEPPKTSVNPDRGTGAAVRSNGSSSRTRSASTSFTEEDEKAQFARLNEGASNAFKPLVVDSAMRKSQNGRGAAPNQVPPYFVNGESTWFFTGTTSFDGVTMALIENSATGEGQYLRVGESLFGATVTEITRNSVTLAGPGGDAKRLILLENRPIIEEGEAANNRPFNPMTGPIGITNRPDSNAESTPTRALETNQNNNNAENSSR